MKILLAEDDFASRKFMSNYLGKYGDCDITVDGEEAVDAFLMALEDGEPLKAIRDIEKERGILGNDGAKIIMTTALNEERNVKKAFEIGCTVYSGKPIDLDKFEKILKKLELID